MSEGAHQIFWKVGDLADYGLFKTFFKVVLMRSAALLPSSEHREHVPSRRLFFESFCSTKKRLPSYWAQSGRFVRPGSSWPPLCRPSCGPGGPARWKQQQRVSPQRTPACPSSWGPGRYSELSVKSRGEKGGNVALPGGVIPVAVTNLPPKAQPCSWRSTVL